MSPMSADERVRRWRLIADEHDEEIYQALRCEFKQVVAELGDAENHLRELSASRSSDDADPEREVEAAMRLLERLDTVGKDPLARRQIGPLIREFGVRLGLHFAGALKGKRPVRKLVRGIMVFGDVDLPVPAYGTSNREISARPAVRGIAEKEAMTPRKTALCASKREAAVPAGHVASSNTARCEQECRREGISITKVNRGERI